MANKEVIAVSIGGAAFGLTTGEFISEFVARVSGQTGWAKFGVKAAVKAVLGFIWYTIASRLANPMYSLLFEISAYSTWGSIVPDFVMAWNPGGIVGYAEGAAVAVRGAAKTSMKLTEKLGEIEQSPEQAAADLAALM